MISSEFLVKPLGSHSLPYDAFNTPCFYILAFHCHSMAKRNVAKTCSSKIWKKGDWYAGLLISWLWLIIRNWFKIITRVHVGTMTWYTVDIYNKHVWSRFLGKFVPVYHIIRCHIPQDIDAKHLKMGVQKMIFCRVSTCNFSYRETVSTCDQCEIREGTKGCSVSLRARKAQPY